MKPTFRGRSAKFLAASAVALLSLYVLRGARSGTPPPPPPPRPEWEHRLVSPHTYTYVLNQPEACTQRSPPFLVLMVPVSPREVAARDAVRRTWGSAGDDTLTLFFTGLDGAGRGASLEEESRTHADIIQLDFVDSYGNLTVKTMMMMGWLAAHCPGARFAMKVDADSFVNVFRLRRQLRRAPTRGFVTGALVADGRPRRAPDSKWRLSEEAYPEDSFPPYVSGAGYVFSAELAARISWASRFVRPIPLEDVYVGLCLRVLGVRPVYSVSLLGLRNLFEVRRLRYDRCTFARLILANGFEPEQLVRMWDDFSQRHTLCFSHSH